VIARKATRAAGWLSLPAAGVLAVLAAEALAPHMGTSTKTFPLLAAGAAGGLALIAAAVAIEPAWILSVGLALSIFSGNWSYLHVPGPLDRVVIMTGIITVLVRSVVVRDAPRVELRRVHWILALLILYAVGSSAWTDTLSQHQATFELLDRLGLVPFLLYLVAPAAFPTERERTILLGTLAVVGAYLGATAFFEMVGPHSLVFPSFILNPALGIHDGRARGPFLEAGADGLAMFCCSVAAIMLLDRPRPRWLRWAIIAIAGLCLLGLVLTLTRQVWVGAAAGALLAALRSRRLRRHVPAAVVTGVVLIGGAIVVVPGLQAKLHSRADAQKPVWDRLNSDEAALRMIEDRPLLGFGWGTFPRYSARYYHVAKSYPLSAVGEVHNVVLSNAVELGAVGLVLWLVGLAAAMIAPFRRRGPPSLEPWKLGLIAVVVAWFVQANFAPLAYAFDNYLPWLFAGIALGLPPHRGTSPESEHGSRGAERLGVPRVSRASHSIQAT
jgi:putative inorganic carbon (hco3(-)) transporter